MANEDCTDGTSSLAVLSRLKQAEEHQDLTHLEAPGFLDTAWHSVAGAF